MARLSQLSELVPGMSKPSMYIYIYIYIYYPLVGVPKMQEVCVHVCVEVLFKFVIGY